MCKHIVYELAIYDSSDISQLKDNEYIGYGVNTGIGSFMDFDALKYIQAYEDDLIAKDEELEMILYNELEEELYVNYPYTRSWLVTKLHGKHDIALFSSGYGDGIYPSFWGLDKDGEVAYLVTDFFVIAYQQFVLQHL